MWLSYGLCHKMPKPLHKFSCLMDRGRLRTWWEQARSTKDQPQVALPKEQCWWESKEATTLLLHRMPCSTIQFLNSYLGGAALFPASHKSKGG